MLLSVYIVRQDAWNCFYFDTETEKFLQLENWHCSGMKNGEVIKGE